MTRTFSREHWTAAQQAWKDGKFSHEWRDFRHQAAMRGILYPPDGTRWDSWEDDDPSERAVLVRAIRETPELLRECIGRSRSWGEVIARLVRTRDRWRADLAEQEHRRPSDEDRPSDREVVTSLRAIIGRIADS